MNATHIQVEGTRRIRDIALVEKMLWMIEGVIQVISVRSMGLVSVLYDETRADLARIMDAVRSAGFEAHLFTAEELPAS